MTTSVTFAPVINYNSSSFAGYPKVVGDFNKDNILDLAYLEYGKLYVAFGNSSGSFNFASAQYYSVGSGSSYSYSPSDVAVGDFNGDGYLDLATANDNSPTVSVLLNNKSGGFSPAITFNVGTYFDDVRVGDFNNDGKDDIAAGGRSITSVLLGNGSGSFSSYSIIDVGSYLGMYDDSEDVTFGDFNNDNILDLVTPNGDANTISVYLGNSSGSFGIPTTYAVGHYPDAVAVGDFNGDGIQDLVSVNYDDNTVSVLLGNGSGSFLNATTFAVGSGPYYVKVGDFNNDGKDDIYTENDNGISVLLNNTIFQGNLTNPNKDDIFQIGGSKSTKIKIKIQIKGRSSALLNELGVFNVDDSEGKIDGVAPGAAGYQEKALARAKTIFSVLVNNPTGFSPENLSRILEFNGGTQLRFYLKSQGSIIFSSTTTQQITSLSTGGFSIGWKDGSRGNSLFDDLQISVQETNEDLAIGIGLQGKSEGEAIDLREYSSDSLIAGNFSVYREASYNNYVGFYKVVDESGGIDTNGDGTADVLVGDAGYLQAAINQRVTGIGLSVANQGQGNHNGNFAGGGIYVPFLIVNGGVDALLDSNTSNDPTVFFTFLGANSDKTQHVRILGDNTFGFEDLVGGGDNDFNDFIVKINLTASA
ncbi:FG-GAP-like repeat-containing protein [Nostoc piscinale]|uniref:FG-GAP-like repeat-containing protein n=1 Tax=Nostoc piscinale TaxID=224012 RepID=UPI000782F89D|nr:FG-GAP-like repeat-containing protein [Nostoc piscinale]